MDENRRIKKPVWVGPWGFTEGWFLALGLLVTGLILQVITGGLGTEALAWPVNMYTGSGFTAILIAAWAFFRKSVPVNWLSRVPAAITSIALVTFLVIVMGFTLQEDSQNPVWVQTLGLSNMTSSWPFLLAMVFFLASLGMATLKRITPFKGRNIGFFLNHAGLYVALMAGLLGSADLQRYTMELYDGEIVWLAQDSHGHPVEMPLAMQLRRFNMEEYNPKITLIEQETGRIVPAVLGEMFEIGPANQGRLAGWEVEILEFHGMSGKIGDRFEPVVDAGAPPSALVRATNTEGRVREGWITCGSFLYAHQTLPLDYDHALAMTIPQASHYSSDVVLYTKSGDVKEVVIEVNKPYSAEGWKLYQYSYDDRFGKWSPTSVIEVIRDPWLPVVYTGIFMLLFGSVYLMTLGKAPEPADSVFMKSPDRVPDTTDSVIMKSPVKSEPANGESPAEKENRNNDH